MEVKKGPGVERTTIKILIMRMKTIITLIMVMVRMMMVIMMMMGIMKRMIIIIIIMIMIMMKKNCLHKHGHYQHCIADNIICFMMFHYFKDKNEPDFNNRRKKLAHFTLFISESIGS